MIELVKISENISRSFNGKETVVLKRLGLVFRLNYLGKD